MSIATLYSAGRIRVYCRGVDEDGESVNIGRWIQNQIQKWRDGKLSDSHYEMLKTIVEE